MENIIKEINERLAALGESVSDARIEATVQSYFDKMLGDEEFTRKMRFAAAPELYGSKYSRLGMSVADIEFLHDFLVAAQAVGKSKGPSAELRQAFTDASQARYVTAAAARAQDLELINRTFKPGSPDWLQAMRAMDTAESGYGSQLVGAQYVGELWAAARNTSRIFPLIETFEMTAPTAYLPVEAAFPEMLYVSESTSSTITNYTTSATGSNRVTVSAVKFVLHQMWSGEMEEDSIIPYIPFLRRQAQLSLAYYTDSLIINGDTTATATGNINLDDAAPAATKHYLALDGIRHVGLVDNTNNQDDVAAAVTYDDLLKARGRMLDSTYVFDWGHPNDPNDLVY
ncbi:MAG: phage major capsid protein, partial [Planctomycetota bacterium]